MTQIVLGEFITVSLNHYPLETIHRCSKRAHFSQYSRQYAYFRQDKHMHVNMR